MNLHDYETHKRRVKTWISKAPMAWIIQVKANQLRELIRKLTKGKL